MRVSLSLAQTEKWKFVQTWHYSAAYILSYSCSIAFCIEWEWNEWMKNANINKCIIIVAKLDERKMAKPFCLCNYKRNAFPFDLEYNTSVYSIRMSDIAHSLHASLFRFSSSRWLLLLCYAFNFTAYVNSIQHSVWITNASHLNTSQSIVWQWRMVVATVPNVYITFAQWQYISPTTTTTTVCQSSVCDVDGILIV